MKSYLYLCGDCSWAITWICLFDAWNLLPTGCQRWRFTMVQSVKHHPKNKKENTAKNGVVKSQRILQKWLKISDKSRFCGEIFGSNFYPLIQQTNIITWCPFDLRKPYIHFLRHFLLGIYGQNIVTIYRLPATLHKTLVQHTSNPPKKLLGSVSKMPLKISKNVLPNGEKRWFNMVESVKHNPKNTSRNIIKGLSKILQIPCDWYRCSVPKAHPFVWISDFLGITSDFLDTRKWVSSL